MTDPLATAALMPAAWPKMEQVVVTRAKDSASCSADMQRTVISRLRPSRGTRQRNGFWWGGTYSSSFGRM